MGLTIPSFIISLLLFFILFYGIGFLLNMLFRSSWIMAVLFPLIAIYIVNKTKLIQYVKEPAAAFGNIGDNVMALATWDIAILSSGFLGAVAAGITMKYLRKKGYQMF